MRILVIGSGGREHAIVWKLRQSPRVRAIFCAPGNGGIARMARCVPVQPDDFAAIDDLVRKEKIDYRDCRPGSAAGCRGWWIT